MNKRILLSGVSAMAMAMTMAAPGAVQAQDAMEGNGAWASINYVEIDGENGGGNGGGETAGTVHNNGAWDAPTLDPGQVRPNEIVDSFNGAQGIGHIQQNEGSANSINAAAAVQTSINQVTPAESGTFVGSTVYENHAIQLDGTRTNDVTNSFLGAQGVFTVQQNNGDQNEIGSAEAIQADQNSIGDVSTNATVISTTEFNGTDQHGGTRQNDIMDSFRDGAAGVFTVQQNNGDHNAIGAATSVYGANGGHGDVDQEILIEGASVGNYGDGIGPFRLMTSSNEEAPSVRSNMIDPSFDGASGIVTAQQNNGNANAISAATAVAGNVGGQDVDGNDDVDQNVFVNGYVDGEGTPVEDIVVDWEATHSRNNAIYTDSFDGFSGIATVQQNNGDHNVLGAATAVNYNAGLTAPQLQNDVAQTVEVDNVVVDGEAYDIDTGNFLGLIEPKGLRHNHIDSSFDSAKGIANVQQNNGNLNAMGIGNAVHVNIDTVANGADNLNGEDDVEPQDSISRGVVEFNWAFHQGGAITSDTILPPHRKNSVTFSFERFEGIATVQQNNGDNNAIGASNAVAAVIDSTDKIDSVGAEEESSVALTEGFVGRSYASEQSVVRRSSGSNRLNNIDRSFNPAMGVITVQQNNGNNNAMNSANAVVANIGPVGGNGDGEAGSVSNYADGEGIVEGNYAEGHRFADRKNNISESFQGAQGIMTVQQNNGSNNVMGAATAVAADVDTGGTGFGPAMSSASLNASVSGNTTIVYAPVEDPGLVNTINSGAFNQAAGIMTVQQNNGSNNIIQSAIAVSANLTTQ